MLENISDYDLRKELYERTGKPPGPITPDTRPSLLRKLKKLQEAQKSGAHKSSPENSKRKSTVRTSTPNFGSLGFSSDEEVPESRTARKGATTTKKNSAASPRTKSYTSVSTKTQSSSSVRKPGRVDQSELGSDLVPSIEQLLEWSNDEIQSKLYTLKGKRYVVNESTKLLLVKRLRSCLTDKDSYATHSDTSGKQIHDSIQSSEPMETVFSDSDDGEGSMDFETTPDMSISSSRLTRPAMVNQSANTSSFLDQTLPDPPNENSDPFLVPPKPPSTGVRTKRENVSKTTNDKQLSEVPLKLPSPNLSSTRRSFVPSSAVNSPAYSKPIPPSPPRSTFARRPLVSKLSTSYMHLNPDTTPKPSSQFTAAYEQLKPTGPPLSRDHSTSYNTGGGKEIKPPTKHEKRSMDADQAEMKNEIDLSHLYTTVGFLGLFMAVLLMAHLYLVPVRPKDLEAVFAPEDVYKNLLKDRGVCQAGQCFSKNELRGSKPLAEKLSTYLAQHAGYAECGYAGYEDRQVAVSVARRVMEDLYGEEMLESWPALMELISLNPHWNIRFVHKNQEKTTPGATMDTVWLESVDSVRPKICIIINAVSRMGLSIIAVLIVAALGYLAFIYGAYRKREQKRKESVFYALIEDILEMLEGQYKLSKEDSQKQPFVAVSHVHDSIISPPDRQQMKDIWNKAARFIKEKETRVREEVQQVHGEEFTVWRWIQPKDSQPAQGKNDGWGGSAIGRYKLKFRPTLCLKVRGMFDVYSETGSQWPLRIQDALLDKLGDDHGVVHLAVDEDSTENRVYMKFATPKQAGKAFEKLHGFYYEGQCIQCKFLLLKTYHDHFPNAEHSLVQLERSRKSSTGTPRLYPSLRSYQ